MLCHSVSITKEHDQNGKNWGKKLPLTEKGGIELDLVASFLHLSTKKIPHNYRTLK